MHVITDVLPLKFLNLSSKYPYLWENYPLISMLCLFCFGYNFLVFNFVRVI